MYLLLIPNVHKGRTSGRDSDYDHSTDSACFEREKNSIFSKTEDALNPA
jgi:hypothetical protein